MSRAKNIIMQLAGEHPEFHPENVRCPICTDPTYPFPCVHHKGPPCVNCRTPLKVIGDREHTFYYCPQCRTREPIEPEYEPAV